MRKFLYIGIAVLFAVLLVSFAFQNKATQPGNVITPPAIIDRGETKVEIISNLKPGSIKIPSSLPVFSLSTSPIPFDEAAKIAQSLDFVSQVERSSSANSGIVYDWVSDTSELLVMSSVHIIDYKNETVSDSLSPFPTEEELSAIAKDFLESKGFIPSKDLEFETVRYLKVDESEYAASEKDSANIADVQLREKIEGYPIINSTPGIGSISVKIGRDKNIIAVYIEKLSSVLNKREYAAKNFDKLTAQIPNAKIQMVGNPFHRGTDIVDATEINKVTIDEASIAYLKEYSPSQTLMQPIFILQGIADMKSGEKLPATLYLPAVDDQYIQTTPTPTPQL